MANIRKRLEARSDAQEMWAVHALQYGIRNSNSSIGIGPSELKTGATQDTDKSQLDSQS